MRISLGACVSCVILSLAGCCANPARVGVADTPAATVPSTAPHVPGHHTATDGPIPWWIPPGWQRVPNDRPDHVATFLVEGREKVIVTESKGDGGRLLDNVNYWRKQARLPSIQEADLARETRRFDNGTTNGHTMLFTGQKSAILAAIIHDPANNRTWFATTKTIPLAAANREINFYIFAGSFGPGTIPDEWNMGLATPQPAK